MARRATKTAAPKELADAHRAHAPAQPAAQDLPAQNVTFTTWARNKFGAKHVDQAAGFAHWCRKNKHTRHSVPEWEALYTEFSNKPVGIG